MTSNSTGYQVLDHTNGPRGKQSTISRYHSGARIAGGCVRVNDEHEDASKSGNETHSEHGEPLQSGVQISGERNTAIEHHHDPCGAYPDPQE